MADRIQIKRGNTLNLPRQITRDGEPLSLTGKTLLYLLKESPADPDADAALIFSADNSGLQIIDSAAGRFRLKASAAETAALTRNFYYGALQIRDDATGAILELPDDAPHEVWEITGHLIKSIT